MFGLVTIIAICCIGAAIYVFNSSNKPQSQSGESLNEANESVENRPISSQEQVSTFNNPWNERKEKGMFVSFFLTLKAVLFTPGQFFETLKISDSIKGPWLFNVISSYIGFCFHATTMQLNAIEFIASLLIGLLMVSISSLIFLLSFSSVFHLIAKLFGGKGSFRGTLNILAFSSPAFLFSLFPFAIGILISFFWSLFIQISGLKRIHSFSTIKALFVELGFPFLIGFFLIGPFLVFMDKKSQLYGSNIDQAIVQMDALKADDVEDKTIEAMKAHFQTLQKNLADKNVVNMKFLVSMQLVHLYQSFAKDGVLTNKECNYWIKQFNEMDNLDSDALERYIRDYDQKFIQLNE